MVNGRRVATRSECDHTKGMGLSGLCAECEDAAHLLRHPSPRKGCFACKLLSVQWSPSCHPSTRNTIAPRTPNNSWEKGIVTQDRPGGTVMPVLESHNLEPIPIKDLGHRRHEIKDGLHKLRNAPSIKES